jgi:hypothetical protein
MTKILKLLTCNSFAASVGESSGAASAYSSSAAFSVSVLQPWYLTGFFDGEACFNIHLKKHTHCKTGWQVQAGFFIGLHMKDKALLELIKSSLGVGEIVPNTKDKYQYRVRSFKEIREVIIPFFDKYPLITKKKRILNYSRRLLR